MKNNKQNILVLRLSALGDVAMLLPVLTLAHKQNPNVHFTVVSKRQHKALFDGLSYISFFEADTKGKHKGISGIYRLYKDLKAQVQIDAIADLHNVLRTKILRAFFFFNKVPVAHLEKGRNMKRALTRRKNKQLQQNPSMHKCYAIVLRKLNLKIDLESATPPHLALAPLWSKPTLEHWVAIAPFAQYKEKMYPLEKTEELIKHLCKEENIHIFLFGGGIKEQNTLDDLADCYPKKITNTVGKLSLGAQMQLIKQCNVMFCMDSANMHLASAVGTPVVSFWGATHPYAGFLGYGQKEKDCIQRLDLSCRPCSVFGNKKCYRKDFACKEVSPNLIWTRMKHYLPFFLLTATFYFDRDP